MNIGKWIVVAFILFTGFIATLVTVCMREDISLVSKEYYKEELGYQKQILRMTNTAELVEKPAIKVVSNTIEIKFSQFNKVEKGEFKLFCPSNSKMDKNFELQQSDNSLQVFNLDKLQKGMYRAKMYWTMDGKEFYHEEVIFI